MAYAVTDACIRCKFTDCVDVCPVDCFYEGAEMLAINPEECIDCGVCEPECPADAIIPDTAPDAAQWVDFNRRYAALWPVITQPVNPPADADDFIGVSGKMQYFRPDPGHAGA